MKPPPGILGLAAAIVALAVLPGRSAAAPDVVRIDSGLLEGTTGAAPGIRVFKGIPYAAPPGMARWKSTPDAGISLQLLFF